MTRWRVGALAILAVACAPRTTTVVVASGANDPSCGAKLKTSVVQHEGSVQQAFEFVDVWSRAGSAATRFWVQYDPMDPPEAVLAPDGWTALLEVCRSGRQVCAVEWRGYERGSRVGTFKVAFRGSNPPEVRGWSFEVGCGVIGMDPRLLKAPRGRRTSG